jgi:hypothetical protein
MIKHIVMWDVEGTTATERAGNLALLKQQFESLRGALPEKKGRTSPIGAH